MAHPQAVAPRSLADQEIRSSGRAPLIERLSWALYEFAHTIFSMNITTLYFAVWLVSDLGVSNTANAMANAAASVLVFLSIPFLGAVSDGRRRRKPWVVGFTFLSAAGCVLLGVLGQRLLPLTGENVIGSVATPAGWHASGAPLFWVLAAFVVANYGYQAAQPFFNAMLPELVPVNEQGRLSGLAAAIGYTGSIVGVLLVLPFFSGGLPGIGKLGDGTMHILRSVVPFTEHAGRVSAFVPTAILFVVFTLPLIFFCRDHNPAPKGTRIDWRTALREVRHTIRDARQHPGALRFILASFVYQDAIGTIVGFMTLYAVKAVGFTKGTEVTLFLVLTIPSILGSYVYGRMVDRLGPKRALMTTIVSWIVLLVVMIAAPGKKAFWLVGLALGLNYGGVSATERPMLLSLVPEAEAGRYFSLMLLSARAAAVIGPLVWAFTVDGLESSMGTAIAYRAAVMTVGLMFLIATFVLRGVPDRPRAQLVA